jgi:hypothetical protein
MYHPIMSSRFFYRRQGSLRNDRKGKRKGRLSSFIRLIKNAVAKFWLAGICVLLI